jgi:hypothetical protein
MTPSDALTCITGIALEYTNGLKDRPCTQEALMLRIQLAHGVLNAALSPAVELPHDRDPA